MIIKHTDKYRFNKHPMIQPNLYGKVFRKDQIIDMMEVNFVNPFTPIQKTDVVINYLEESGVITAYNELIADGQIY